MSGMSFATIDAPEFINVTSINPLISKCEIKVLYVGKNRNKTEINKDAATAIGKTLPGSPIVGYYKPNKKDYSDHGQQIVFDDEGMKVNDLTRPYGFVPTDAKVWFQKFVDVDLLGQEVIREYLMTEGYLWTGQYKEAQKIYESEDGNPHSMKLHDETLQGHWTKDVKTNVDFFIINDAIIQNLCILGEDVEPCFETASISAPKISANFSKNNFVTTLFTMMQELNDLLKCQNKQGGNSMPENIEVTEVVDNQTPIVEDSAAAAEKILENSSTEMDKVDETITEENQVITETFTENVEVNTEADTSLEFKKEEEEEDKGKSEDKNSDEKESTSDKQDEEEDVKKKYSLLEQSFAELQNKYSALEVSYNELVQFKNKIEDEQKDALIAQFYMLSDEDKKDVIENKSQYSLDDIEAKLSIICVRKKVNFDLDSDNNIKEDSTIITYNLADTDDNLPAWLKAVEATKKRNQ